jgi:hypothetical protein
VDESEVLPALKHVEELEVLPARKQLVDEREVYLLRHKSRVQLRDRQCPPSRPIQDGLPIRTGAIPMMREQLHARSR